MTNPEPCIFLLMKEDLAEISDKRISLPGWYFSDEAEQLGDNGPFGTIEECRAAMKAYGEQL